MNKITRKLRYAYEDFREYRAMQAMRFLSGAAFWSVVAVVALILLPFDQELRQKIAAKIGNSIGRLFWHFRSFNILRELFPPMRNLVRIEVRDSNGRLKYADYGFNLRTNVGRDWQCDAMSKSASRPSVAQYISVHNASGYTPNATDTITTWQTNEYSTNGFGRYAGTYVHTPGNANYTLQFTYSSSAVVTIYGAALLDTQPTGGIPFCIKNFATPASMAAADTLQVTWDITV